MSTDLLRAIMTGAVLLGAVLLVTGAAHALPDQFMQEGLLTTDDGAPLDGVHRFRVRLLDAPRAGALLFEEIHPDVELHDGYYSIAIGSVEALPADIFAGEVYLSLSIDDGAELLPRVRLAKVPGALVADVAYSVVGDIDPRSVSVGGNLVIDEFGRWVGDPGGLRGPAGPAGAAGPAGPIGPVGPAGGEGSPDTPAQVLAKLVQVDGTASTLDADRLDGIDSVDFVRTAAQVLQRLVTVDGAGSGIDADRLDGIDSAGFVTTAQQVIDLLRTVDGEGSGVDADRLDGIDSSLFVRTAEQVRDLLRGVDGEGSGIDGDRLDGIDSTQFMRADRNTGTVGSLAVTATVTAGELRIGGAGRVGVGVADPQARLDVDGTIRAQALQLIPRAEPAGPSAGLLYFDAERAALRVFDGERWIDLGAAGDADPGAGGPDPAEYARVVLADGPAAYWPLDERQGARAADHSGFDRHGTYVGTVLQGVAGQVGRAVNIRSQGHVDNVIRLGDMIPADRGTVTAVIRLPDAYVDFGVRAFQSRHHVWSSRAYWQGISVGRINGVGGVHFWSFWDGQNEYQLSIATPPDRWVHVAWVMRGGRLYGYVNGVESSVAAPRPMGSLGIFNIGRYHNDANTTPPPYPAEIQHVAVYATGLSAERIRAQVAAAGLLGADGNDRNNAGRTCRDILDANPGLRGSDGLYWINPGSDDPAAAVQTFCDMTIDGGGWSLAAYSPSGSVRALCAFDGNTRNLHPMTTGGGAWDPARRASAASLPAVSLARRSTEMLLARSERDGYTGGIGGADVANKFTIPDPAIVHLDNASPTRGDIDRGACTAVRLTTLRGPEANGAVRYTWSRSLMVTWGDTYPTGYGVNSAADCQNNSAGPAYTTSFTGRNWPQRYCWPHDALGGAFTYWHLGWWDATQHDRTGSVMIWFR